MPRARKRSEIIQGQSTISKFFNSSESKQPSRKRDASEKDNTSCEQQPAKLAKSEISNCTITPKENVLLSSTVDRIKQFMYQEDSPKTEKSLKYSDTLNSVNALDPATDVFQEKSICNADSMSISDEDDETMCVDVAESSSSKGSDPSKKAKYTPLEQQYLDLKKNYPDAILLIECGYKYRMFREDAQIASRILNIGCYVSHNFHCASIPTHRLSVHVRRLVANGHKVGVVKQTETAALKAAGENRNTLFSRKLHALYTTSTLIGEDFNTSNDHVIEDNASSEATSLSGYLTCIYDIPSSNEKAGLVSVGIMSVNPTTGDVTYASFDDTISRSVLESFLMQVDPVEIIHPESSLTDRTANLIKNFCDISLISNKKIRIEKLSDELFDYTHALNCVSEFFGNSNAVDNHSPDAATSDVLQGVMSLPPVIICCISSLISYLSEFHLEVLLKNWRQWQSLTSSSTFMALNAAAVRNLEILKNSVDGTVYGTLFWTLNSTRTKFGEKLLKSWLTKPLKDLKAIAERQDAVSEVLNSQSNVWSLFEKLLSKLPDLEKLLCAAFYHRCTCSEFVTLVKTLIEVKQELNIASERINIVVQGSKIKQIVSEVILLLENVDSFMKNINEKAAREEDKTKLFIDTSKYVALAQCEGNIKNVEEMLNNLKPAICRTLRLPAFNYTTVMGQRYLIEVKNSFLPLVPSNWMKISSTKQVSRFRSPEIETLFSELRQLSEELKMHCVEAWNSLLDEFSCYFYKYKKVIEYLAQLDCVLSFAKLAKQDGFCRPVVSNKKELNIIRGRNPIVSKLLGERYQYVANDTNLDSSKRCMIVTGPNMGGKSSYVRQVALIAILAQAGSYVPAEQAELPIFDGVYIRMGADDDVVQERRSTFFTEMLETSGILSKATDHSLVILDELGRGTSTHDGSAIAHATLDHLIEKVKCITLFVTHYPDVASQLQNTYPESVLSCHMAFLVDPNSSEDASGDDSDVTFLYTVTPGIASNSYGINVARLAGIESEILTKAKIKSAEFENYVKRRKFIHSIVKYIMEGNVIQLKNLSSQMMQ